MNVNFDFSGKNFVVVGASSGIGKQTAIELAESGANVLAIGRNIERLDALKNICPEKIFTVSLDVTSAEPDDWSNAISDFIGNIGKIDGGVYSAGINGWTPLNSFDVDLAHKIFDTSFWGMMNFMKIATKKKLSNVGASFVMMSSLAGTGYLGSKGMFAYAAAKAAVTSATKAIAKEIIRNRHRINAVSPAKVQTEMIDHAVYKEMVDEAEDISHYPLGLGKATDISAMILFLLSDRAGWITGQNFSLDGGYFLTI